MLKYNQFYCRCGNLVWIKGSIPAQLKSLILTTSRREETSESWSTGWSCWLTSPSLLKSTTGRWWAGGRRPSCPAGSSSSSRDTWWVLSLKTGPQRQMYLTIFYKGISIVKLKPLFVPWNVYLWRAAPNCFTIQDLKSRRNQGGVICSFFSS